MRDSSCWTHSPQHLTQKTVCLYPSVAPRVFLPQRHQRHAGTLELLVDGGEIGGLLVAIARHRRAVQPRLQFDFAQRLGHRPVHPAHAGQRHVLAHHALGHLEHAGHLALGQLGLQMQAQCLSDLAHRDSCCGHRRRSKNATSLGPFRESLVASPIVHDNAEIPSTITLNCRPRWAEIRGVNTL